MLGMGWLKTADDVCIPCCVTVTAGTRGKGFVVAASRLGLRLHVRGLDERECMLVCKYRR
jgi:hypothetical protein